MFQSLKSLMAKGKKENIRYQEIEYKLKSKNR